MNEVTDLEFSSDLNPQIQEFVEAIAVLPKSVADTFCNCFHALLSSGRLEFPDCGGVTASRTGSGRIILRVFGVTELIMAARAAKQF